MLGAWDAVRGGQPNADEKFSYEAVVLRRITELVYEPFIAVLERQRSPGAVVIFTVANLREMTRFGMRGLEDVSRFIGAYVFDFFPPAAERSYLAWSMPSLFVPADAGCEIGATVEAIRESVRGRRLELSAAKSVGVDVVAGTSWLDRDAGKAVAEALEGLNLDLQHRFGGNEVVAPLAFDWIPRFPADYLP